MQEELKKSTEESKPLPKNRPDLLAQLANIISLHNDEHQTWISVFFASLTTNALLFIALFTTGDFPINPVVALCIAVFGCCVTLLLSRVQSRALLYMKAYETLAKTIEDDLELGKYAYTKKLKESLKKERKQARPWISAFNWLVVMLWVLIAIYSCVTLLKPIL
jgi:hypothetical protein